MRDHHEKEIEMYAQKSGMYHLLARYYQYIDPNKHMMYYKKHYEYMKKLAAVYETRENDVAAANTAAVRLFHASPDIDAVDIHVNGQKVLHRLKYKQISQYLKLPTGQYQFDIYPTGQTRSPILSETVYILPSLRYTVAACGKTNRLQLLPFFDNPYVPYGETKIRFAYLSPDVPAVNIALKDGDVLFKNVRYKDVTDYTKVPTDQRLTLELRDTETDEVMMVVPNVRFGPNRGYTIIASGYTKETPSLEAVLIEE